MLGGGFHRGLALWEARILPWSRDFAYGYGGVIGGDAGAVAAITVDEFCTAGDRRVGYGMGPRVGARG